MERTGLLRERQRSASCGKGTSSGMSELCRLGQSERCGACDDDMPGLPKVPAAEKIDVDADGKISGLF